MKLSTKAKFAITAMITLAVRDGEGTVRLAELAREQGISISYLEQLFARLRRSGLVKGKRGQGGGYVLGCPADEITIADIVGAVDSRDNGQDRPSSATIRRMLDDLSTRYYDFLGSITLASVVEDEVSRPGGYGHVEAPATGLAAHAG